MKQLLILLSCLILLQIPLGYAHSAEKWSKQDVGLEMAWETIHIIDWLQTRYIAKHPDEYYERGLATLAIGSHPSVRDVDIYMGGWAILHPIVTNYMPTKAHLFWTDIVWYPRTTWQYVSIFSSGLAVGNNMALGIKIGF